MRLELKGDIGDLRRQFETLEAGRLTRAEAHINDLRVQLLEQGTKLRENQAILSTKVLVLWAIANVMLIAVGEVVIGKLMK